MQKQCQRQRQSQLHAIPPHANKATVIPASAVKVLCITIDLVLRFKQGKTVLALSTARGISIGSLPELRLLSASKSRYAAHAVLCGRLLRFGIQKSFEMYYVVY